MRVHVTDMSSYRSCRRYFYFRIVRRKELEGAEDVHYYWFGDVGHKSLARYYRDGELPQEAVLDELIKRPLPQVCQEKYGHLPALLPRVLERYHHYYTSVQPESIEILSVETEYTAKLPGTDTELVGTLDLVYRKGGVIFARDHKFYSAASWPTLEGLEHDDQTNGYCYLLRENFPGQRIGGLELNLILKAVPEEPWETTRTPYLSRDKSQNCTYDTYMKKILDKGYNPDDFAEILEYFKQNEPKFFERILITRGREELDRWGETLAFQFREMDALLCLDDPTLGFYPTPQPDCSSCEYQRPCKILNERGDWEFYLNRKYVDRVGRE